MNYLTQQQRKMLRDRIRKHQIWEYWDSHQADPDIAKQLSERYGFQVKRAWIYIREFSFSGEPSTQLIERVVDAE